MNLTPVDIDNLLVLVQRSSYRSLDEAEVAVVLKQKLLREREEIIQEQHGSNVPDAA